MSRLHLLLCRTLMTLCALSLVKHSADERAEASPARLELRDSALSADPGSWSVGVFNPLKLQFAERWGLELHPLAFFMNPHARLTHRWLKSGAHELSGVYGLSLPSLALNAGPPFGVMGYLGPSCLVADAEPERGGCQRGGWGVAPLLGAQYGHRRGPLVLSASVDVAVGVMLTGERPLPLDSYAPIEQLFAPLTNGYRVHTGGRAARRLSERLSGSLEINLFWIGAPELRLSESPKSPWSLSAHLGLDFAFTDHLSGTLGVIYWNSDQRAMEYEDIGGGFQRKTLVRSHDFWPTFDLIWSY